MSTDGKETLLFKDGGRKLAPEERREKSSIRRVLSSAREAGFASRFGARDFQE